jgi:hypothetical protein
VNLELSMETYRSKVYNLIMAHANDKANSRAWAQRPDQQLRQYSTEHKRRESNMLSKNVNVVEMLWNYINVIIHEIDIQ